MKRYIFKILKITGASVAGLLILLFLIPILFPGTVVEKVKSWTNRSINGELNFSKVRLSFFNHFPSLTVTLYDVSLKGSAPFKKDTLVAAHEIAMGINIRSLIFGRRIHIDEIYVSRALINVLVNKKGEANYNVYAPEKETVESDSSGSGTALKLEKIDIEDTRFYYSDKSIDLLIDARDFNYVGNGDLSKDIFDLNSRADIGSLDFYFDNEAYLINKQVRARLITKVNTNSLAFFFERNNVKVNDLPVRFSGKLNFLKNGYDMDLTVSSAKNDLHDLFTALPPQYIEWLKKTEVNGTSEVLLTLKGKYIASSNTMPDLAFDMNVRDGFIRYDKSPFPVSNMHLDFKAKMPSLNMDSLKLDIDSVFLNVDKDYLKGVVHTKGFSHPDIFARIKMALDMEKADRAFGFASVDLKGRVDANLDVNGKYDPDKKLYPVMDAFINVAGASIKTTAYPNPISNIRINAKLQNHSGALKDMHVELQPFSFEFEGKPFTAQASLNNFENIIYDIKVKGEIDVARVYKVFAIEGLDLKGFIAADLALQGSQSDAAAGNYARLNNQGTLQLRDIRTKSSYFPLSFVIRQGLFTFKQDKVSFDEFRGSYGQSDFTMNGYLQNVIDYALSSNGVLQGQFDFHSNYINANEFTASVPDSSDTSSAAQSADSGVVVIPPQYNLSLNASADKVRFKDIVLDNLKGAVSFNNGAMYLKKAGFGIIGCRTLMDMAYSNISRNKASFDYHIVAKDFDIKKAYDSIKLFHDLATAAGKVQGIVSIDYQLKGVLDGSMSPVYPSLEGGGVLSLQDVKVMGLKMFSDLGKKMKNDSINNPNLKKVDIKSSIKNNVITIERFKFKMLGFRPRIEGKTNFDGQLDLKMRLGLPPFGIIGIPMRVSGTQEDPKIKLGRQSKEEVKETEYIDK